MKQGPIPPDADLSAEEGVAQPVAVWRRFCNELSDVGAEIHRLAEAGRTPEEQAEVNQGLLWMLASGAMIASQLDPERPDWVPVVNSALRSGAPNPDAVHYLTRIRGSGQYRICGDRGTVKLVYMSLHDGFFGVTPASTMLQDFDLDTFSIDPDGKFEIGLGAEPPPNHAGNWITLDPDMDDIYIFVRQISYDWLREDDARLSIMPMSNQYQGVMRDLDVGAKLERVADYLGNASKGLLKFLEAAATEDRLPNALADHSRTLGTEARVRNQSYIGGTIEIGADEAFCVEIEVPERCTYWNVQLRDSFFNGLDPIHHQTSLNGHSAEQDPDGKVRLVVSERDPGCANWLDKGDLARVVIRLRWFRSDPVAMTSKIMAFSNVRRFLHPDAAIIAPMERAARMRLRMEGAQRRRRW